MFGWVQVLRGIAASLVVAVHYVESQHARGAHGGEWLSRIGGSGVDVFFVISGFIMMHGQYAANRQQGAGEFLANRLMRIAPLYWILTTVAFGVATLAGSAVNRPISPELFGMSMAFLPYSDVPLNMQSQSFKAYVLLVAWTLTYEWYFYLVLALSLWLRLGARARLWMLAGWFLISALAGYLIKPDPLILQIMTGPLLLEFLLGCGIAAMYHHGLRIGPLASLAAILLGAGLMFVPLSGSGVERVAIWGSAAFCLIAAATLYEREKIFPPPVLLAHLGDISYSLYLSNFFVVAIFTRLQTRVGVLSQGFSPLVLVVFILMSWAVAELLFRVVEQPSRRLWKRHANRSFAVELRV